MFEKQDSEDYFQINRDKNNMKGWNVNTYKVLFKSVNYAVNTNSRQF